MEVYEGFIVELHRVILLEPVLPKIKLKMLPYRAMQSLSLHAYYYSSGLKNDKYTLLRLLFTSDRVRVISGVVRVLMT